MQIPSLISHPRQRATFISIVRQCDELTKQLKKKNIIFHSNSAFGKVLRDAELVADQWENGERDLDLNAVRNTANAYRIANACIAASDDVGASECLRRVILKNTDLSSREASQGKDALWELELAQLLRRNGTVVAHAEPDLICNFHFGPYPIACKKINSPGGVENQVRQGVKQLAKFGSPGIVALNIDDVISLDGLTLAPTRQFVLEYLDHQIEVFRRQQRNNLLRFLGEKRCDGILIAATGFAMLARGIPDYDLSTATALWSKHTLDYRLTQRLSCLRNVLAT